MPCTRPIGGYRLLDGTISRKLEKGTPYTGLAEVACGACPGCRVRKAEDWAVRCHNESQMHPTSSALTLTYDQHHLPQDLSLDYRHVQLFLKRLRKFRDTREQQRTGDKHAKARPIKFLTSGEYGDNNLRPHYHMLLFGEDFADDRTEVEDKLGNPMFISPTLARLWGMGSPDEGHRIQQLVPETINYVCRYTLKKILGTSPESEERRRQRYERVNALTGEVWTVKPEFATMSRGGRGGRGGIGSSWFAKYHSDAYPSDFLVIRGKEKAVPRYYDQLLEQDNEKLHARVKRRRQKSAASLVADNTPERRQVKENVLLARQRLKMATEDP